MKKTLLNALLEENMNEVARQMIGKQYHFVGSPTAYTFEEQEQADAIDAENLLVKTDVWMKNTLELDDASKNINRFIYLLSEREDVSFDYQIVDCLKDELHMALDVVTQGYTYNDADGCRLNRDIHYSVFEYEGEHYAIFSVHHGADARGGFGDNACFRIDLDYFFSSMNISAFDVSDDNDDILWYQVGDMATYNPETDTWIHDESGAEIILRSEANGW